MEVYKEKNGVKVRAYKGDAMTLLAFDLYKRLSKNLAGFTIKFRYKKGNTPCESYIYNRLLFPKSFLKNNPGIPEQDKNSTLYSPIQKFNWVHVPSTDIGTGEKHFGDYEYEITPRYIINGILQPLDNNLTVNVPIHVGPFETKNTKIGFTRGFVSSVAYARRFDEHNNKVRPCKDEDSLLFNINQKAGTANRWDENLENYKNIDYTFAEQHEWLGWQARERILEFLDETIKDKSITVKVFAYDLDEPEICDRLLTLANQNRLKIILDDSGDHGDTTSMEAEFERLFRQNAANNNNILRGHFGALAHSKIFIQVKNNEAVKLLTGSTNFSTNGLYVNSNHVIIFENKKAAQLYNDVFDASFSEDNMKTFKGSDLSTKDHKITDIALPEMTITFAPHTKDTAKRIFDRISERILKNGNTDVLFAIMKDTSKSSILDAVQQQVKSDKVFTYGITDTISKKDEYSVYLYKPNSKRGIRVAAKGIANTLPEPFGRVPGIKGYAIHHKFIVVNFKGKKPVVYCGSSNLSFTPEQNNGDNLLEIHDKDIVTAFAIEALRLVDHFHWRNNQKQPQKLELDDLNNIEKAWYHAWFANDDLKNRQRKLYIKK